MSTYKALGILRKVGTMKAYDMDAPVRIEYGNATFHTAQLHVTGFLAKENQLIVKLAVQPTDCKAKETCGAPETIELANNECVPGSGCC